jgi:hypothetical protein
MWCIIDKSKEGHIMETPETEVLNSVAVPDKIKGVVKCDKCGINFVLNDRCLTVTDPDDTDAKVHHACEFCTPSVKAELAEMPGFEFLRGETNGFRIVGTTKKRIARVYSAEEKSARPDDGRGR